MFLCVAPLVLALANPFDLTGAEFLVLFPCIAGIAAIVALFLRYSLRPNEDSSNGELTPYQVACLADGIPGVVRAAIVSLVDRKVIEIGGLKTRRPRRKGLSSEKPPRFAEWRRRTGTAHFGGKQHFGRLSSRRRLESSGTGR